MKMSELMICFVLLICVCGVLYAQPNVWINELHYDNQGGDVNEFVEVAVPDDFSDWDKIRLCLYNGANGELYDSHHTLDEFVRGSTSGSHILFYLLIDGIQNGAPDGLCLDYDGAVIQFLSYEGIFTAVEGPASGLTSTDIGVQEDGSTSMQGSIGLVGDGDSYADFEWHELTATRGTPNHDQSLPVELLSFNAEWQKESVLLSWRTASECNNLGFYIERGDTIQGFRRRSDFIPAAGTTSEMQSYSWRDTRIVIGHSYQYQLVQQDQDGKQTTLNRVTIHAGSPAKGTAAPKRPFAVLSCYPNPFNPETVVSVQLTEAADHAELSVYNLLAQRVVTLRRGALPAGESRFLWDGKDATGRCVPAGLYVCRFHALNRMISYKLLKTQ